MLAILLKIKLEVVKVVYQACMIWALTSSLTSSLPWPPAETANAPPTSPGWPRSYCRRCPLLQPGGVLWPREEVPKAIFVSGMGIGYILSFLTAHWSSSEASSFWSQRSLAGVNLRSQHG